MTPDLIQRVRTVITHLVAGDYAGLESLTRGRRLSAEEMRSAIAGHGRRLVPPPDRAFESDCDVIPILDSDPPAWAIVMNLWTDEEGRSDLSIELTLTQRDGGFDIELDDIHVL